LASDGKWYPPQSRPLPAPPAPPAPPRQPVAFTLSPGITTAVRIFMFITAGLALCAALAYANVVVRFGAWWTAPAASDWDELANWESAEEIASGFLGVMYLGGLVLLILLVVWGNQACRSIERFGPTGRSWSPGWAVGGWFIPLANVVIPKVVLNEVERVSNPENGPPPVEHRWRQARTDAAGNWWWILSAVSLAAVSVGSIFTGAGSTGTSAWTFDAGAYRAGLVIAMVGLAGLGAAQIWGAHHFRRLGDRLSGWPGPGAVG
jgi:hypothetical protein